MKKINSLLVALMLLCGVAFAQTPFQGTIKYGFNFMGEGIEAFEAMFPTGMEINVLKTDISMEIQGGMAAMAMGRTVSKTKSGLSYMIKDSEEKIYVMDPAKMKKDDDPADKAAEPVVTKEDETITIAGYECQKYKIVTTTGEGESTAYVWVTDKFQLPKSKVEGTGGMGSMVDLKGVPGAALKIMTEQMGMTVTITAKEISTTLPPKSLFKLPKGYAKEDFDASKMMGGGM